MPLFSFRLDVPALPGVVAERLRAVVKERPGLWESWRSPLAGTNPSGALFLGSIKGNAFHLKRKTDYRNSFLPRIWGSIDAAGDGARMKVVMFMHPLAFLFTVVWLAGVGYNAWGQWRQGFASSLYIQLGMMVFGFCVSMGGFFGEVVKARSLLCAAVSDATINSAPQTAAPQTDAGAPFQSERAHVGALRVAVVVCLLLLSYSVFRLYTNRLRDCPAFAASVEILSKATEATAALGEPIRVGSLVRGMVHQDAVAGYALLTIPVQGSKAGGTLFVVANRFQQRWDLGRVALWLSDSKRLDLSPPTQRDSFRYPALGHVYLIPLDNQAASDLTDLPGYLSARLGLEVTVMPALTLGPDTVDSETKQVIAEKAAQYLERASPRFADELDSVFLGVTSQDLNIKTNGWTFATCYRNGRVGLFSTARFHGTPWYAGPNPEVFGIRFRKMVARNVALLHYPVSASADPTSVLAEGIASAEDADKMGENIIGERTAWLPSGSWIEPCVTITQDRRGRQTWRLGREEDPPADSGFEIFENDAAVPVFVMARTDFPIRAQPSLSFVRKYRTTADRVQTFGIGTSDSFDIFPTGDSDTLGYLDLTLAAGEQVHFDRVTRGTGVANARFQAGAVNGDLYGRSFILWNGNGWDLKTVNGWTFKFPDSGPDRGVRESSLLRIEAGSGPAFSIERSPSGDLRRAQAPDGSWIEFTSDSMRRIVLAKNNAGRTVQYEYDKAGRLTHFRDSEHNEEFYQYDPIHRLTAVLDVKGHPLLQNTYGFSGEITSQTLADGRKLIYEYGWDERRFPDYLEFTDPQGYVFRCSRTQNGYLWRLPVLRTKD